MSISRPTCPNFGSQHTVKNGKIHNQKLKYQCQNCKRQFIENPTNKVISKDTIELIDRLLLEKIPLAGIARAALVSETWLQKYVNNQYAQIPQQVNVSAKTRGKLTIECDEAWYIFTTTHIFFSIKLDIDR
jgi:transposase-like protein